MKDVIIVGSGFGGLSLAIRLQSYGISTIIVEQRNKAGGSACFYENKGFILDLGPTVITDPNSIKELFDLSNKKISDYLKLLPVNLMYRLCWNSGKYFNYFNDDKKIENEIKKFNSYDVEGYKKFLNYSKNNLIHGYLDFGKKPFLSFWDMFKIMPILFKLSAWNTLYDKVSSYISDNYLRQVFSFNSLFIGGNPYKTSSMYSLIHALEREWGIWYPKGGVRNLVKSMVNLFISIGGKILFNSKVCKIELNNNKIKKIYLHNGLTLSSKILVSNFDIMKTYMSFNKTNKIKSVIKKLKLKKMSNSLFIIYFGLNYFYDKLAHHTVHLCDNYKNLIEDIFENYTLSKEISFYLHSPCVTDSSLAPKGCGSHYILLPVPNLSKNNINWNIETKNLISKLFLFLEKKYMPKLRDRLVFYKVINPIYFKDELSYYKGSTFSYQPLLKQSAWFRVHNKDSFIKNLYFVGSGTHPGAGIPGVLASAKITSKLILEDLK